MRGHRKVVYDVSVADPLVVPPTIRVALGAGSLKVVPYEQVVDEVVGILTTATCVGSTSIVPEKRTIHGPHAGRWWCHSLQ